MGLILNEIALLFSGEKRRINSEFNSYTHLDWSLKPINSREKDRALKFWEQQFSGLDAYANCFPYDSHSERGLRSGERVFFEFENTQSTRAIEYCKLNGVTLFNLYFAAFNVLLYKYNRDNEMVIGVPFANRSIFALESTVGNLVNVLPIRTNIGGHKSLKSLLKEKQQGSQQVLRQQGVPFSHVRKELRLKGGVRERGDR